MKVFWSWQSDTPGNIGRHFVRDTLAEAVQELRQPGDIEEPSEREVREALHLDHDRKGVPGSPDLAPTIFAKIAVATVFVADVTLVAEIAVSGGEKPKRLINSNVAIEYGYALGTIGDGAVLTVQNAHYGPREDLPFDLKHKAVPIQFTLSPGATKAEIKAEKAKLKGVLTDAILLCLEHAAAKAETAGFEETLSTGNKATFWEPTDVLAQIGFSGLGGADDRIDYRFAEQRVFYLRLIPTSVVPQISVTTLHNVVQLRRLQVLTPTFGSGTPGRNRFGAIVIEPHGTATTPLALSQLFRNGEIWGVTSELAAAFQGAFVVPMVSLKNFYERVLENYVSVARDDLGIPGPYQIEMGAVGLKDMRVSLPQHLMRWPNDVSEPICENEVSLRRVLNDTGTQTQQALVAEFIAALYDLAAVRL